MIQKYPPDIHVVLMEHDSTNYGKPANPITTKNKQNYQNSYGALFNIRQVTAETPSQTNQQHEDEVFKNIKGFLIFGKLIGVLPFSGIFGNSWKHLSFRKKSCSAMITYGIVGILIFNVLLGLLQFQRVPKRNALEISQSIRLSVFNIWGCLTYIIFLWKGKNFLQIFKVWSLIKVTYSRNDRTLRRDTFIICGGILTSGILENMVLHLEFFQGLDNISGYKYKEQHKNMTDFEAFYWRGSAHWAEAIGYNWFFAVIAFFAHKWTLYGWNFLDIAIAVFGRAMYFRFKCLYEEASKKLLGSEELRWKNSREGICKDQHGWVQVVYDHQNLCRLLDVLEDFFSPMVFISYLVNIYFICMQLLDGLTNELSKNSIIRSIYLPWSFLHLVMRTFVVSICCAPINVYAHKIRHVLQECPPEHFSKEVSLVHIQVTAGPNIGFTGVGCFTVTKPFILSMLGVVFTFEIVLLQCVPSS